MNHLKCSVQNCGNNESGLCCLQSINVGGTAAHTSSETNCSSFVSQGSATNSVSHNNPSEKTEIKCTACNCEHNDHNNCNAGSVSVDNCASGTECRTFKE